MDDGLCPNCAASPCQRRGQEAGLLGGHPTRVLLPGVACALNEARGHQQDELRTRDFCWWWPVMPKSHQLVLGIFHTSVLSALESYCCVLLWSEEQ